MTVIVEESQGLRVKLPQLSDPDYKPCTLEYLPKALLAARGAPTYPSLEDWIEIFRHSIGSFRRTAASDPSIPEPQRQAQAEQFASSYLATVNELEARGVAEAAAALAADLSYVEPVTNCLDLCRLREQALRSAGFTDIFRPIKAQENERALALLQGVCTELDEISEPRQRWEAAVRGVFAGNIFDLGCAATTDMYHENGISFHDTREKLLARPWVVDCMDPLLDRLVSHTYRKAVLFVDNSGADVILGMVPLARELLKRGTHVILAANEVPSINDITAAELEALLPRICSSDCVLCKGVSSGRLQVLASGSDLPVIDLAQISMELADACQDADLIVLEGMGRSIETNLNARLNVDCLKCGMIKHPEVAAALGGRLYDCICKFELGCSSQAQLS